MNGKQEEGDEEDRQDQWTLRARDKQGMFPTSSQFPNKNLAQADEGPMISEKHAREVRFSIWPAKF